MCNWVGGFHESGKSKVKYDQFKVKFLSPSHPIFFGVKPWDMKEEYYFDQYVEHKNKQLTPLIGATLVSNNPDDEIAWAVNPKKGGRGFVFTGCHSHSHLHQNDYRKFVLNAIVWTAGLEVPKEGVISNIPPEWE
jgi:hypothetical protein